MALLILVPMLALPTEAVAVEGHRDTTSADRNLMGGYDCGYFFDHCFGTVEWNGNVDGSTVKITVNPTAYMNTSNWFITNEMWLKEEDASPNDKCSVGGSNADPWMEVGMIAAEGQLRYFWNACAPGGTYDQNWIDPVPSGDYNKLVYFKINRSDFDPDDYKIWIASPTLGTQVGLSYDNIMSPNRIQIGQELGASSGGYWNGTGFWESEYIHGSGYYYQFRDGDDKEVDSPPYAWWDLTPAPGNNGGRWQTYCPC